MADYKVISLEGAPPDAKLCPVCKGYKVVIQAALSELPIDKPYTAVVRSCPCCYGLGWVVVLMQTRSVP